jgi:hypothetical protein
MVLDRQAKHQLVQALLRARERRGSVDVLEDAAQTHAYAKGRPPMNMGPVGSTIWPLAEGSGEALWNWLTKPPPLSCPADGFPPVFPPLEKRGNFGGSSNRDCDEEWKDAREICKEELSKPNPNRRMTGGHLDVENCARGFVSQRCGGNRVK